MNLELWGFTKSGIKSYKFMPNGRKDKSLKKKYSLFFSNKIDIPEPQPEPENSVKGVYPSLEEFKNSIEETDPVLRNMDMNVLQKLNNDRKRSDQRSRETEGSLELAFQSIKEMEVKIKELSINKAKEEPKKAPIILMEDNLTKTKRALMALKQLCPTGSNKQSIEMKANIGEKDEETLN